MYCQNCGDTIEYKGTKPPKYCSDKCRMAHKRESEQNIENPNKNQGENPNRGENEQEKTNKQESEQVDAVRVSKEDVISHGSLTDMDKVKHILPSSKEWKTLPAYPEHIQRGIDEGVWQPNDFKYCTEHGYKSIRDTPHDVHCNANVA